MLRFYGFELLCKRSCSLLTVSVARFLYLKVIECFQQVKHVISQQWLDFSHWWMCLFREVVNNSLVRYWRASTFNIFFWLSNFQGEGVGMYIFRSLTNHPFIFFCSHLLDVCLEQDCSSRTSTTPLGNKDTVHISFWRCRVTFSETGRGDWGWTFSKLKTHYFTLSVSMDDDTLVYLLPAWSRLSTISMEPAQSQTVSNIFVLENTQGKHAHSWLVQNRVSITR